MHDAGVPITVVPTLETDHHIAATTTAGRALRAYYSGSARRRFESKHGFQVLAPGGRDPWNLAVGAAARMLGEHGIGRAGRAVDRLADRLPRWVAEKAVALTVEAGRPRGLPAQRCGSGDLRWPRHMNRRDGVRGRPPGGIDISLGIGGFPSGMPT